MASEDDSCYFASKINGSFYKLKQGIPVPSNSDFNNYKTPGIYSVDNYSIGLTIINSPHQAGGKLIVEYLGNAGLIAQTWMPHDKGIFAYRRIFGNDGWGEWLNAALKSDFGWKHLADVTTNNPISFPESANEVFLETLIRKGESYFFDSRVLGKINKGAYQVIKFLLDGYGYYLVNEMGSVHFSNFKVGNDTPDEFMVTVRYR